MLSLVCVKEPPNNFTDRRFLNLKSEMSIILKFFFLRIFKVLSKPLARITSKSFVYFYSYLFIYFVIT